MSEKLSHQRLEKAMEAKGWSARALSIAIGRHRNTLYNILNHKNKTTKLEVVHAIAEILEVSPFYLIDKKKDKKIQTEPKTSTYNKLYLTQTLELVEKYLKEHDIEDPLTIESYTKKIYPVIEKAGGVTEETAEHVKGIVEYAISTRENN